MITAELRRAILAAAGLRRTPTRCSARARGRELRLQPAVPPGPEGSGTAGLAADLAAQLVREPWIAAAEVTGPGFLTVTVTHDALAASRCGSPGRARPAQKATRCAAAPCPFRTPSRRARRPSAPGWPQARAALAAQLTARLAAAAGATLVPDPERAGLPAPPSLPPALPGRGPVAEAAGYAGTDAVRFALARLPPGAPASGSTAPQAAVIARHVLANPAYAVRYAHAAAAAVLRWAAALGTRPAGFTPRLLAEPGELALLDALSWLPERVAVAARRGRPDEFAGYLEELAARTIDTMSTTSFRTIRGTEARGCGWRWRRGRRSGPASGCSGSPRPAACKGTRKEPNERAERPRGARKRAGNSA